MKCLSLVEETVAGISNKFYTKQKLKTDLQSLILIPPFAETTCPVTHPLSSLHNIPTTPAISLLAAGLPPSPFASPIPSCLSSSLTAINGAILTQGLMSRRNSSVNPPHISVFTGPGLTALTVPRSANSLAHVLVKPSTAAFDAPYTLCPTNAAEEDMDDTFTIRPLRSCGRNGSTACMTSNGPSTLI